MKLLELSIGGEDFNRLHLARLTVLDVSIAIGHEQCNWVRAGIDIDWGRGYYWGFCRVRKAVYGEDCIEMLLRRFAPGWLDR